MVFEGHQAATAYPMEKRGEYGHGMMKPGHYAAGTIASIQNDESGNPAWIVSGHWKASISEGKAGEYGNQTSAHQTRVRQWDKICRTRLSNLRHHLTW